MVREWLQTYGKKAWSTYFGFDASTGELQWLRIHVKTNIAKEMPAPEVLEAMHAYEAYVEARNAEHAGVPAMQTSSTWVRTETEDRIMGSTLLCGCISLVCALVAILAFTGSAVVAVSVVLTVLFVVICLSACMFALLGWRFGAIEAIGLIVFVGFSVDYTLHVGEAFHRAPEPKVETALRRVGAAVAAAAATTGGSACFLFACTIQVFIQFGIAVVLNTLLSFIIAVVFFPALLARLPRKWTGEGVATPSRPREVSVQAGLEPGLSELSDLPFGTAIVGANLPAAVFTQDLVAAPAPRDGNRMV